MEILIPYNGRQGSRNFYGKVEYFIGGWEFTTNDNMFLGVFNKNTIHSTDIFTNPIQEHLFNSIKAVIIEITPKVKKIQNKLDIKLLNPGMAIYNVETGPLALQSENPMVNEWLILGVDEIGISVSLIRGESLEDLRSVDINQFANEEWYIEIK